MPTDPRELAALEAQIRECFGRVIYTHKTHSKMADRAASTLKWLKAQPNCALVSYGKRSNRNTLFGPVCTKARYSAGITRHSSANGLYEGF